MFERAERLVGCGTEGKEGQPKEAWNEGRTGRVAGWMDGWVAGWIAGWMEGWREKGAEAQRCNGRKVGRPKRKEGERGREKGSNAKKMRW